MKKSFLLYSFLLIVFAFTSTIKGQPLFEKGYYIDNQNIRYEGFIDRTNLTSEAPFISFKSSKKSDALKLYADSISEIFVSGIQIKTYLVSVDTSALSVSNFREPVFVEDEVFLFGLIIGETSLFEYRTDEKSLFFIQENSGSTPSQLIRKIYIGENGKVYSNNTFRDQIDSLTANLSIKIDSEQINYTKESLIDLTKHLNSSIASTFEDFTSKAVLSPRYLNIGLFTGIRFTRLISRETITDAIYFDLSDASFSNLGVELEYLIPNVKNRVSFFGRGEIAFGKQSGEDIFPSGLQEVTVNTDYLFLTMGFRGYVPIFKSSKIYADLAMSKPFKFSDGINVRHEVRQDFEYQYSNFIPSFGVGITSFNRFSLESRFEFINKELTANNDFNNIYFTAFTVNLKVFLKSYYSIYD